MILLAIGALAILERIWKYWAVVRFFARHQRFADALPPSRSVTIIQPILSGDPTLPTCLDANLELQSCYDIDYIWLVDDTDTVALRICAELIACHPKRRIRVERLPRPGDARSPKTVKLIAGAALSRAEILLFLDDDTMLPPGGLEECLPALDQPGVGLAFGLPYYVSFGGFWTALIAYFVNSYSLLTYLPVATLTEPFTINGMCFAMRRATYEQLGGFTSIEHLLADDFAIAQKVRVHGYRLAQSTLRHPISTHVAGPRAYFSLIRRWCIFPKETVMRYLGPRDLLIVYGLGLFAYLFPLALLCYALLVHSVAVVAYSALYLTLCYGIFAHSNIAYLRRASPWGRSWLVPLIQVLFPIELLIALCTPNRITWRGHVFHIERGGGFRVDRWRTEPAPPEITDSGSR